MSENNEQLHPKWYNSHPSKIECIEVAQYHNFNIGSIIKYVWRLGLKDGTDSIDDLHKIINYANFEIARLKAENWLDEPVSVFNEVINPTNDNEILPFNRYYISIHDIIDDMLETVIMPKSTDDSNGIICFLKYNKTSDYKKIISRKDFVNTYRLLTNEELAELKEKGWVI